MCGLSCLLAPSHWLVMEVQQKLLGLYTRPASPLSRPQLERKVQLGGLVLRYMDLVDPANPASSLAAHPAYLARPGLPAHLASHLPRPLSLPVLP